MKLTIILLTVAFFGIASASQGELSPSCPLDTCTNCDLLFVQQTTNLQPLFGEDKRDQEDSTDGYHSPTTESKVKLNLLLNPTELILESLVVLNTMSH